MINDVPVVLHIVHSQNGLTEQIGFSLPPSLYCTVSPPVYYNIYCYILLYTVYTYHWN